MGCITWGVSRGVYHVRHHVGCITWGVLRGALRGVGGRDLPHYIVRRGMV